VGQSSRAKQAAAQQRKAEREHARARERRERKEAEQRLARRRATRGAIVRVGALFALIGVGCLVAVFVLIHNDPTRVTGDLQGVRDLSFVEGTQNDVGVSPVCGCAKPPLNEWRGVTFAARQLTLARTGRSPWTEWSLTSADPAPISLLSNPRDWLTITAVRFRPRGAFDPHWMLADMRRHVTVLSEQQFSAYKFLLLNHRPLHVAMLGPVPVGAWVPFPGSHVTLHSQPSSFPQDPSTPTLTETYPPAVGTRGGLENSQGYSLGDFMLPDLVLWSDDRSVQMPETPLRSPAGPGVVTALLFRNSTFSLRVAATPLTAKEFGSLLRSSVTQPAPRQPGPVAGAFDHGHITLTLNQPLSPPAYDAVKASVAGQQVTRIAVLSDPFVAAPNGAPVPNPTGLKQPPPPWRYSAPAKYPPMPLYAGFNVWGPLGSVTFSSVTGHASVGANALDLSGAPDLTLSGVQGLRSASDQQLVTAPLETSSQSAKLEFRAVANVSVNGNSETSGWAEHKTALAIAAFLATIIGAVVGVAAFAHALRRETAA
jgi:hypothetical protein